MKKNEEIRERMRKEARRRFLKTLPEQYKIVMLEHRGTGEIYSGIIDRLSESRNLYLFIKDGSLIYTSGEAEELFILLTH